MPAANPISEVLSRLYYPTPQMGRLQYGIGTGVGQGFTPQDYNITPVDRATGGGMVTPGTTPLFSGQVPIQPYVPPVVLSPYSGAPLLTQPVPNTSIGGDTSSGAQGAPAGQSFSEGATTGLTGGPAFSAGNIGRNALTTAVGLGAAAAGLPISPLAPFTAALGLEKGLNFVVQNAPGFALRSGMISPTALAQRSGLISGGHEPDEIDVPTEESEGITAPAAPVGQVGLTAQGGLIGGVGGPPGGMADVANPNVGPIGNVVEGPPGGLGEAGPAGPGAGSVSAGLTAGEVGVAGQGAPSDAGGGGGGGGDGGGCFLATFGMQALSPSERQRASAFFGDFKRLYFASNPRGAPQLFSKYQVVARRIIDAIKQRGPDAEKKEQKFIYDRLIKPTGAHIEKREVPEAVRNLTSVVTTLAKRYDVPLPAQRTTVPGPLRATK